MAPSISPEEFSEWLSPPQAEALLRPSLKYELTIRHALLERLKAGLIQGIAAEAVLGFGDERLALFTVPKTHWDHFSSSSSFWATGSHTYEYRSDRFYDKSTIRLFDVRFGPTAVRSMIPATFVPEYQNQQSASPAAPRLTNPGGRPRKDFWDDFWIEICRQIYEGDLKPKSQADLARAMHQWVEDHDYDAGETVIKVAARKLWKAWKLGGEN